VDARSGFVECSRDRGADATGACCDQDAQIRNWAKRIEYRHSCELPPSAGSARSDRTRQRASLAGLRKEPNVIRAHRQGRFDVAVACPGAR